MYQLVLQSPVGVGDVTALEDLAAAEERIIAAADDFEVDGHDIGSGQMNIFVVTDDPEAAYESIKPVLGGTRHWIAAYREIGDDEYVVLEPKELEHFEVL